MPDQRAPQSGAQSAYEALINCLRNGDYGPDDRLREQEVAQRLGLSRTPVREALRKLEADGIIEHRARVGAVIKRLDHTEMVQLYEMRVVLERTAAQLAAKHGTKAEFATLKQLNAEIAASRDRPAHAASINQQFHMCVYHAARNQFLLSSARALNQALLLLGPTTYTEKDRVDDVLKQHDAIINALEAGDVEAAGKAAEAHLEASLRYRLKSCA